MIANGHFRRDIAKALDVTVSTLYEWRAAHKEFADAFEQGSRLLDGLVVDSLYKRAIGYDHLGRHYPPSEDAAKFILKNRDARNWSDRVSVALELDTKLNEAEQATAFALSFKATMPIMERVASAIEMRTLPAAEAQGTATIAPVVSSPTDTPETKA